MPEFITVCEKAVRLGAVALMERFGQVEVHHKGHADLVTEADYASQEVIRRTVLGAFEDHDFLGEETLPDAPAGPATGTTKSEYRWIVDPLDGTTNYVHQVPFFSVSLALERAGELVVGCVYNPVSGECFSAIAGEGARLNGKPLQTSNVDNLGDSLTSTGFPYRITPIRPT